MKKATLNYWVDLATGIAFLLCAVTGIVFLFPGTVHTAIGATPTILLIPARWWHSVHDWTGVAMVAGTALHLALHARWITTMTRKTFGARTTTPAARAGRPSRTVQPAASPATVGDALTLQSAAEADAAAAASLNRLEALRAERLREREQRISRRRFLTGAAAVGGAALLVSLGLAGREAVSGASTRLRDDGWTGGGQGQAGTGTSTAGASGGSSQSSSSSATSSTRVVVDQSACVACGRCLQTCPKGVFDWASSGRAEAISPDTCIRCGRCLQVCPAGAITVSA